LTKSSTTAELQKLEGLLARSKRSEYVGVHSWFTVKETPALWITHVLCHILFCWRALKLVAIGQFMIRTLRRGLNDSKWAAVCHNQRKRTKTAGRGRYNGGSI